MHDNPQFIVKTAFDLDEYRNRKSNEVSKEGSSFHETNNEDAMSSFSIDAQEFIFRDNVDVEDFIHMSSMNQYKFKINMRQFDPIMSLKLPYVFDGPNLRRANAEDNLKKGYWQKLLLTGSGQPVARENATLMPILENG